MKPIWGATLAICVAIAATGCASTTPSEKHASADDERWLAATSQEAEQERQIADLKKQVGQLEARLSRSPAVHPSSGAPVSVMIEGPNEGIPGQVAPWRVQVTNHTNQVAVDLEVRAQLAEGMTPVDAGSARWDEPARRLHWEIPSLPAGQSASFTFTIRADGTGHFVNCVDVAHRIGACDEIEILQPALACQVSAGELQTVGQPFGVVLAVANTGSGVARNVQGDVSLRGLQSQGSTRVDFGDIPAGQRVERRFDVVGTADGEYEVVLNVRGAPELHTTCAVAGRLVSPNLAIEKVGPKMRYEGLPIDYRIRVTSTGSTTARGVVLLDPLPPYTRFVKAGQGGQLVGNAVQWNLGDLEPGQSREVELTLTAEREGKVTNCAKVRAAGVPEREACVDTTVLYVAAMHINCLDTDDPVAVGGETTYVIDIKNEGHRQTTEVLLRVHLPEEAEFLGAEAPTGRGTYDRATHEVVFTPLPVMQPDQTAVFRIRVRFTAPGSAVCSAVMTFKEFSKPVRSEEGTNIFE